MQGQKVKTSLTMTFSDYGTEVDVQTPPASQVTNLAELA